MKLLLILFQALMLITFVFLLFFAAVYAGRKRKEKKANKRKEQRRIQMTIVSKYQSEYFTVQKLCDKAMDEQLLFELN